MRPVVRSHPSEDKFDRVRSSVDYKQDEEKEKIEVKLKHRFEYTGETTYIAFTYPYSYKDGQVLTLSIRSCALVRGFRIVSMCSIRHTRTMRKQFSRC